MSQKTALITGGGSGIGAGIARAFAEAGFKVAISGRRAEVLEEVAASTEHEILCHAADVANRESVDGLFAWAAENLGRIDVFVNSAGINIPNRSMEKLSPEDWDMVMQVNSTGAFNCLHAVLPQMRERKDGVIINICSVAGIRTSPLGGVVYNASKFAMDALGRSVGEEERENGIRVTTIYPGEVETPILDKRPNPVSAEHRARILQPEDLAAAALMVAQLPPRARIPELAIIPTSQSFQ